MSTEPSTIARDDLERYSRQLIVRGWSLARQRELGALTVRINPALPLTALYLAGAGIGRIVLPDGTAALAARIGELNPSVEVSGSANAEIVIGRGPCELREESRVTIAVMPAYVVSTTSRGSHTIDLSLLTGNALAVALQAAAAQLVIDHVRGAFARHQERPSQK